LTLFRLLAWEKAASLGKRPAVQFMKPASFVCCSSSLSVYNSIEDYDDSVFVLHRFSIHVRECRANGFDAEFIFCVTYPIAHDLCATNDHLSIQIRQTRQQSLENHVNPPPHPSWLDRSRFTARSKQAPSTLSFIYFDNKTTECQILFQIFLIPFDSCLGRYNPNSKPRPMTDG
jgi:hypothetical protein